MDGNKTAEDYIAGMGQISVNYSYFKLIPFPDTSSNFCVYAYLQMGDDLDQSRMILLFEVLRTSGNIG
jgi:hypothetical protein